MEERNIAVNVLDRIVCIRLDVNIWSGQKKLTAQDLGLTPDQIPPEELAALGRKRICDPQALAVFRKLKERGERLLRANGVRFLDGYAVPANSMARINEQLDDLGREFKEARTEFVADYDNAVESWIARHPDWTEQLRRAIEPVERVAGSLNWRRHCFQVVHPGAGTDPGLAEEVGGLGGQLLREIAQEAKETFDDSYKDKEEVTRRALRPLHRMYQKMLSLNFLEPKVRPFLDLMIGVIKAADGQPGRIAGQELRELQSLLLLLMEPGKIMAGEFPVFRVHDARPAKAKAVKPQLLPLDSPEEPDVPDEADGAEEAPVPAAEPLAGLSAPPVWF